MQTLAQDSRSVLNRFSSKLKPRGTVADLAVSTAQSLPDLDQFLSLQQQLEKTLATIPSSHETEELSEVRALMQKRKQAISNLASECDEGVRTLRSLLDSCGKLLETRPTTVDPDIIIKYSYRLRHAYTPLGATTGLPMIAPVPEPPFMLASNLNQFNLLQQQEQQKQLDQERQQALQELQEQQRIMALISAHLPPDWQPGDDIPAELLQLTMQGPPPLDAAAGAGGAAAPAVAVEGAADQHDKPPPSAAAAAPAPLIDLGPLNQDLEDIGGSSDWDDDDMVDEEVSEEDDSED